jgi:DNA-binding beta-propeller fold protein YncE
MKGRRRWAIPLLAAVGCLTGCLARSAPPDKAALVLERTIPLTGVAGRIDHLAYDPKRGRIFIAELGNGSVEGVDLASGRSIGRIGGLKEPQGLAFLPDRDELAVASGGDGSVRFYRGVDLAASGAMQMGDDADNLRVDPASGRLVVGYGAGVLAVIDAASGQVLHSTPLPAHPEGFQLDGDKAFVNLPDAGRVGVADLAAGKLLASWPNGGRRWNFPLAFEATSGQVAVVYRLPSRLVIFDAGSGVVAQALPTCGDSDDAFFDTRRGRLYVVCGDGHIDVFARKGRPFQRIATIATVPGARTALFLPALDRLYVAVRAAGGEPAAIQIYRPN